MNPRYLLVIVGLLLFIVDGVAREGGTLDRIAGKHQGGGAHSASLARADTARKAAAPAPSAASSASSSSSNDFFANWEPPEDGGMPVDPSDPSDNRPVQLASATSAALGHPSNGNVPVGALTDEQLGVEGAGSSNL